MPVSARASFERWRVSPERPVWGLAWFLAHEFCRRFYASHGIAPWVISREGHGFYGIQLGPVRCRTNRHATEALGRLSVAGNVENWQTGEPGDHGLRTEDLCAAGAPADELVERAVKHVGLPPAPPESHVGCRHQRWGRSFELCFEVAAIIALQNSPEVLQIWNEPELLAPQLRAADPHYRMREHPGGFHFVRGPRELLLAADGRLLDGSGNNLWTAYMLGQSVAMLAEQVATRLR